MNTLRSRIGLDAANFFLAEVTGVALPFLGAWFKDRSWSETAIGVVIAVAGLGVFVMQTPAGMIADRVRARRTLLAGASVGLGLCYGALQLVPSRPVWVGSLLFASGVAQAFFLPLLGALALGLVGHAALNRTIGRNQGWNHAGNLASALLAMGLIRLGGVGWVFYGIMAVSFVAAASVFLIRADEANRHLGSADRADRVGLGALLRDRRVKVLVASTALFHLANAPVMPFLGAYVKTLGGSDQEVAAVVLVAQLVMIPVALAAGRGCDRFGRKPIFAIGFIALPVRIFLYSLASAPLTIVLLQALDGIGAGIYGVVVVAMCADLTRDKGGFNALSGLLATALAVGGVIGPLVAGYLADHLGYHGFLYVFAGLAAAAAALFLVFMPETTVRE